LVALALVFDLLFFAFLAAHALDEGIVDEELLVAKVELVVGTLTTLLLCSELVVIDDDVLGNIADCELEVVALEVVALEVVALEVVALELLALEVVALEVVALEVRLLKELLVELVGTLDVLGRELELIVLVVLTEVLAGLVEELVGTLAVLVTYPIINISD
jgi:hypothetical protein